MHCWQNKPSWFMLRRSQGVHTMRRKKSALSIALYACVCCSHPLLLHLFPSIQLPLSHSFPSSLLFSLQKQHLLFCLILCPSIPTCALFPSLYWNALPCRILCLLPDFFIVTLIHLQEAAIVWKYVRRSNELYWITADHEKLFSSSAAVILFYLMEPIGGLAAG